MYVPSPCTDHVEDVVTAVFQYLAMIRREGPQKWIFQECAVRDKNRDLSGITFPTSHVSRLHVYAFM